MAANVTTAEEIQAGLPRIHGRLLGTVIDVADPMGLHRVRAEIPGYQDETGWLFPITMGGGSPQHGGHVAPALGATILVEYLGGDPQGIGVYEAAWWGARPNTGSELPGSSQDLAPADAAKVHALEVGGFSITIDERGGKRQLVIEDKALGSTVQMNGELGEVVISGSVSIRIEAPRVAITAADVSINGRSVLPDSRPI